MLHADVGLQMYACRYCMHACMHRWSESWDPLRSDSTELFWSGPWGRVRGSQMLQILRVLGNLQARSMQV